MTLTDYMCQEKEEKEDLPALKTVLTYRYNDSKTTYIEKRGGKPITTTRNNIDNTMTNRTNITR